MSTIQIVKQLYNYTDHQRKCAPPPPLLPKTQTRVFALKLLQQMYLHTVTVNLFLDHTVTAHHTNLPDHPHLICFKLHLNKVTLTWLSNCIWQCPNLRSGISWGFDRVNSSTRNSNSATYRPLH